MTPQLQVRNLGEVEPGALFRLTWRGAVHWMIRAVDARLEPDVVPTVALDDAVAVFGIDAGERVVVVAVNSEWRLVPEAASIEFDGEPKPGVIVICRDKAELVAAQPDNPVRLAVNLSDFSIRQFHAQRAIMATRWRLVVPGLDPSKPWLDLAVGVRPA